MRIFPSEYSLECENRLKFCEYLLLNEYLEANIRQYEKILENIRSELNICCNMYFSASNRIFVCESVKLF
jgi:hypothetical protein